MKLKTILALVAVAGTVGLRALGQNYDTNMVVVQTFAGSGFLGHYDGQGTQTMFVNPWRIVPDSFGDLYVLEAVRPFGSMGAYTGIRKITPDATVTTFAGGGAGDLPGYGTNISLGPVSWAGPLTIDHSNTLWTSWVNYGTLLRISSDAYASWMGLSGNPPVSGLCMDSRNNLYISSESANQVYVYRTNAILELFVGSGNSGSEDGSGIFTSFNAPRALVTDAADNIYVWDSGNGLVRRINQDQDVVTIAGNLGASADGLGTNAAFGSVSAMCVDGSGSLILACGSSIRKMTPTGKVTTIAGSFTQSGYTNGSGPLARFSGANGVCLSGGVIFVADSDNQRIRSITFVGAPVIVAQPYPQTSCLGQSATFQVTVSGNQPLAYQWWSQGGPLLGQTSTNLVLTNLLSSQAGAYWAVVSNQLGSVTSAPAQLVMNDACVDLRMYAGLNIAGQPGASYVLSYTTNLSAPLNWLPLATNTMIPSGWFYVDTNSPFSTYRFYNVRLKP